LSESGQSSRRIFLPTARIVSRLRSHLLTLQPTGTESAALWTIGLDGGSPAELLTLWRVYGNSATLSTLPDEIDSMAPDVNPSIDTDGPARVGDLGADGK
jgi:hypothetical protein